MIIQYKTPAAEDRHIDYSLRNNRLTFDDKLTIKLDKYERDENAHIDICEDRYGNLVMGVIPGITTKYVAQIDIPARTYHDEETGESNENDEPVIVPVPAPYDPANTTLTLWEKED